MARSEDRDDPFEDAASLAERLKTFTKYPIRRIGRRLMDDLIRMLELAGMKPPTIVSSSTGKGGGINRKKANKMVDPKGWFKGSKSYYLNHQAESKSLKAYLALVEAGYERDAPVSIDAIRTDILEIIEAYGKISADDLMANMENLYPDVFENTLREQRIQIIRNMVKQQSDKIEFRDGMLYWKGAVHPRPTAGVKPA